MYKILSLTSPAEDCLFPMGLILSCFSQDLRKIMVPPVGISLQKMACSKGY